MKILVIHNSYLERGGEDEVVESEIKLLEDFGHKVIFYRRTNKDIKNFSLFKKIKFLGKEIIWSKDTYIRIKELVRKEKPDIAHIHNTLLLITPSVYCALCEEKIPIVQTLHNFRLLCPKGILYRNDRICEECVKYGLICAVVHRCWRNSFILTLALVRMLKIHFKKKTVQNKIDAYITLSKFNKDKFVKVGLAEEKIFVKPNFVDIDIESRNRSQDFILFVGRLVGYKGIKTLITAFRNLAGYNLKIIGDGPLYGGLTEKVKKISNIDLLGRLSYKETQHYIRCAAFLVFPSECYESTPRVVIESFSCGVPILVSDRGFKASTISKEGVGLEFRAGDSSDLTDKVRYLMNNKQLLEKMGKNAFKVYKEKYTPQKSYELLMGIYNKVIELYKKHEND